MIKVWGIALLLLFLGGCAEQQEDSEQGLTILTVAVKPLQWSESFTTEQHFFGYVEALRESSIGFDISGQLVDVKVDEGDYITGGQVLAQLDDATLKADFRQFQGQLREAKARQQLLQSTLKRNQQAQQFGGVSDLELEQIKQQFTASQAAVTVAQAQLNKVNLHIKKSQLKAPYDALVTKRHWDEGSVLSPAMPLLTIQETQSLQARFSLNINAAQRLEQRTSFILSIDNQVLDGQLKNIVRSRNLRNGTVEAIFTLDVSTLNTADVHTGSLEKQKQEQNQQMVMHGSIIRLDMNTKIAKQGFWVNMDAVTEAEKGLWRVFVAEPIVKKLTVGEATVEEAEEVKQKNSYLVSPRMVEVLHIDQDRLFVRGAIKKGEYHITGGLQRIVEGQRVYITQHE